MEIVKIGHNEARNPEQREVLVTLDNGTTVHIESCYESWQQWGGTVDELRVTVSVADMVNDWLHDRLEDFPEEVYSLVG